VRGGVVVGEGEHDRVDAEQRRTIKVGVAAVDVAAIGHVARRATATPHNNEATRCQGESF
jgi:hypothetical protein